jgi:tetratricopeptide (TPR) repeat protein
MIENRDRSPDYRSEKGQQMPPLITNNCRVLFVPSLLISLLLVAGCAGAPPEEKIADGTGAGSPSSEEIIIDAEVKAQNDQLEEAAEMLVELVEREQTNTTALRLLANIYAALGLKDQSTETWEQVAAIEPYDPDAAYETGIAYARKGKWLQVRSKMLSLDAAGVAQSRHYLLLGEADMELGYSGEAEKHFKKASGEPRAHYLLGKLYYSRGRTGEAENEFRAVLRSDPSNYSAHLHLGWLSYRKGNRGTALEHYSTAVRLNPRDPLSALSLAGLLEEMKKKSRAIDTYRDALSLPGIPKEEKKKAYNSLSRLLVEAKRFGEAEQIIHSGLDEFPTSGGLYYQWGIMLLAEGQKDEALDKLRRAAADPIWKEAALRKIHTIR